MYVRGLTGDLKMTLGTPEHFDAKPGAHAVRLADLGDGTWKLSAERDRDYEDNHLEFIRRFPGQFSIHVAAEKPPVTVGKGALTIDLPPALVGGGKALAVRLEKQPKERRTMPFYTTLVPDRKSVV